MYKRIATVAIVLCSLLLMGGYPSVTTDGRQNIPGPIKVFGDVLMQLNRINSSATSVTVEDITLYVRIVGEGGNDTNDCLTVGSACATPQEAMDRIPKRINHAVAVDIGEGSFGPLDVSGFVVAPGNELVVAGTLGDFAPSSGGKQTGTATGGSTTQCVDAAGGWDVNNLRGTLILVNGEWRVVRNNDATTINLVGPLGATCNGKVYAIEEQKTVITGATALTYGPISASHNVTERNDIVLRDLKVSTGTAAVYLAFTHGLRLERMHVNGGTYAFFMQSIVTEARLYDCYAGGVTAGFYVTKCSGITTMERNYAYNNGTGFNFAAAMFVTGTDFYADASTGNGFYIDGLIYAKLGRVQLDGNDIGLRIWNTPYVDIDGGTIENSTSHGIVLDENDGASNKLHGSGLNATGTISINGNGGAGILAKNNSVVGLTNVDGTNTTYGLELQSRSYATITAATGITGASGSATINDGTTALVWATHFDDDGDKAVNIDTGCRIERRD